MSLEIGIDKIFNKKTNSKQIHEAILYIENSSGNFSHSKGYGGKELDSPLLMASITKLFTTACILSLWEKGSLSLEDKLTKYFDDDTLSGLHIYKGNEYSFELTISDLLFQTSGLPDAFESGNISNIYDTIKRDVFSTFEEGLASTKKQKPHFAPRTKKKAYYSNINFDILGEIIIKIIKLPLEEIYKQFIFEPLGLKKTYLPISDNDFVPKVYYKDELIYSPKIIMSSRASGGCITTARELMIFIKAFFNGVLFDKDIFYELSNYSKLQTSKGPINYGGGYMQIPLEGVTTLFMGKGELLGHSGSTGSFAFYYPNKDLFIVGDMNQMANPALPIRLIIQLAMMIK
jgi:CubicO group peptidase (beta-lactamase class C family)